MNLEEFKELGLSDLMLDAVASKGFETPSPIQKLTIPVLLGNGDDLIAQAQTGTGKTAAFGLPVMQQLEPSKEGIQALILVPTRELALQVTEELSSFNKGKHLSIVSIYGGASISEQLRRLKKGVDIVVATPGRCLDHIRRGTLDLTHIKYMILDEADEMLNMGFIEDIEEIMSHMNNERRVLLFSATMPQRIIDLSKRYMHNTKILRVENKQLAADLTDQIYFEVRESDKFDALTRIIDVEPEFYGIVFSRTKIGVDEIVSKLLEQGYAAEGLHGDVSQAQREKTLKRFKSKQINILVATDVAARGIDINNLTHVINYSLPQDTESYVHRIGRTGRAGKQGTAITFISSSEFRQFASLKKEIKAEIKKEVLPSGQDVVAMKKTRIFDDLREIVETDSYEDYQQMAGDILAEHSPEVALGALLRLAFKHELEEASYPEIRSINVDRRGTVRLFLSIGRLDGYDARKLVSLLKRECKLSDSVINDIKISDSYSFVTVPFNEAEGVIRQLNALRKGSRPIAEIASPGTDKEKSGRRSDSRSSRGRRQGSDGFERKGRDNGSERSTKSRASKSDKVSDRRFEKDSRRKSAGGSRTTRKRSSK